MGSDEGSSGRAGDATDRRERLKVVFRRVHREGNEGDHLLTVFCQRQGGVMDLRHCRACEHCRGLSIDPSDRETFLRCSYGDPRTEQDAVAAPAGEAGSPAARTPLSAIMTSPVRAATREMTLHDLTALFLEQGISAVPVVDDEHRAIGVVSKTDVLRRYYEADEATGAPPAARATDEGVAVDLGAGFRVDQLSRANVGEVMTHVVFCLERSAPISRAAALMAYEGVHRLVITSPDGRAEGIVSSLDVLRWMARCDGYVVPNSTHPRPNDQEQDDE